MGFYFAWLIHYTGQLIPIMVIGAAFGGYMAYNGLSDHPINFVYGLVIMIWVNLFSESWIRTQNKIANEWLVRDFRDVTTECKDFKAEISVDPDTKHKWKVALKNAYER